jgi:hypothetical protein
LDFSIQYEIRPDQSVLEFEPRFFRVERAHQYQGSYLGSHLGKSAITDDFDQASRFLSERRAQVKVLHEKMISILKEHQYTGPVGVDGLIARDSKGEFRLVPVIEVNVRYTMGRVAHEIEAALRRRGGFRHGIFVFLKESELLQHGARSFSDFEMQMRERHGADFVPATVAAKAHSCFVFCLLNQSSYVKYQF